LHFSLCNSWPHCGHQRQYSPDSTDDNTHSLGAIFADASLDLLDSVATPEL